MASTTRLSFVAFGKHTDIPPDSIRSERFRVSVLFNRDISGLGACGVGPITLKKRELIPSTTYENLSVPAISGGIRNAPEKHPPRPGRLDSPDQILCPHILCPTE